MSELMMLVKTNTLSSSIVFVAFDRKVQLKGFNSKMQAISVNKRRDKDVENKKHGCTRLSLFPKQ